MVEDSRAEEELKVVDLLGQPSRRHVEVGLHQQLAAAGGRVAAVVAEGFGAAEGGEEVREEGREERVVRAVWGVGDFGDEGLDGGELRAENLPSGGEGGDGVGGGE